MKNFLTVVAGDFLHLLAPSLCPGCDDPVPPRERGICPSCRASLETAPYPEEIFQDLLARFSPEELALDAVGALYNFEPDSPVQRVIHAIKYRGCRALGETLGEELALSMQIFPEFRDIDIIVPVPLHRARLRERGFNQAEAIARGIQSAWNVQVRTDILRRTRHTQSQTRLSATARQKNISSAFVTAGQDLRGVSVALCDDVFTTGATLNACALQLHLAGADSVRALTLARDEHQ